MIRERQKKNRLKITGNGAAKNRQEEGSTLLGFLTEPLTEVTSREKKVTLKEIRP